MSPVRFVHDLEQQVDEGWSLLTGPGTPVVVCLGLAPLGLPCFSAMQCSTEVTPVTAIILSSSGSLSNGRGGCSMATRGARMDWCSGKSWSSKEMSENPGMTWCDWRGGTWHSFHRQLFFGQPHVFQEFWIRNYQIEDELHHYWDNGKIRLCRPDMCVMTWRGTHKATYHKATYQGGTIQRQHLGLVFFAVYVQAWSTEATCCYGHFQHSVKRVWWKSLVKAKVSDCKRREFSKGTYKLMLPHSLTASDSLPSVG